MNYNSSIGANICIFKVKWEKPSASENDSFITPPPKKNTTGRGAGPQHMEVPRDLEAVEDRDVPADDGGLWEMEIVGMGDWCGGSGG